MTIGLNQPKFNFWNKLVLTNVGSSGKFCADDDPQGDTPRA
jgi:hypothetical protein